MDVHISGHQPKGCQNFENQKIKLKADPIG